MFGAGDGKIGHVRPEIANAAELAAEKVKEGRRTQRWRPFVYFICIMYLPLKLFPLAASFYFS